MTSPVNNNSSNVNSNLADIAKLNLQYSEIGLNGNSSSSSSSANPLNPTTNATTNSTTTVNSSPQAVADNASYQMAQIATQVGPSSSDQSTQSKLRNLSNINNKI